MKTLKNAFAAAVGSGSLLLANAAFAAGAAARRRRGKLQVGLQLRLVDLVAARLEEEAVCLELEDQEAY